MEFKTLDDLQKYFDRHDANTFRRHMEIYGRGGLGYKPHLDNFGSGIIGRGGKKGNYEKIFNKDLENKTLDDLLEIIQTNEDNLSLLESGVYKIGGRNNEEKKQKIKQDIMKENEKIDELINTKEEDGRVRQLIDDHIENNDITLEEVNNIGEEYVNPDNRLNNILARIEKYIEEKKEKKNKEKIQEKNILMTEKYKRAFEREDIKVPKESFNWDKKNMRAEDIEKLEKIRKEKSKDKKNILLGLEKDGLITEDELNEIEVLPLGKLKYIDELLRVVKRGKYKFSLDELKDLPLDELEEKFNIEDSPYKRKQKKRLDFAKKFGESPSLEFLKTSNAELSNLPNLPNIVKAVLRGITDVGEKIGKVLITNDYNFNDPENLEVPYKVNNEFKNHENFEYITAGILENIKVKKYIDPKDNKEKDILSVELEKEYDDIYKDKYLYIRSLLFTLDKDIYDKIDRGTKIKAINFDVNTTFKNTKTEYKADSNAPIDNYVEIKIGNDIYKYGIENKLYEAKIDFEYCVKENDKILEKVSFKTFNDIQSNINVLRKKIERSSDKEDIENMENEIKKLSESKINKQDLIKEIDKKYALKTINIKHTKAGLKKGLVFDPKGISSEKYYEYLKKASEGKRNERVLEFLKVLEFKDNGEIKGVIGNQYYNTLFKDSKLLYFVGCKNNINVGMNFSEKIENKIVNKDNILLTNRLAPEYYGSGDGNPDNHIAFRPDLFKIVKNDKESIINSTSKIAKPKKESEIKVKVNKSNVK